MANWGRENDARADDDEDGDDADGESSLKLGLAL